jgi:hypothetical protein
MSKRPDSNHGFVDFDLHGFVGVRCVDASPRDAAAVSRQLGPIGADLSRDPDIVIHFVDRLNHSSGLRYLEVDDVAFTDDAFFVLRGKFKSRTKVQIPFDAIGGRCEIICERGLTAVPLLIDIVNATALAKRYLPLHAAAFNHEGVGALVTGWSKGGKTETLLAFMAQGAEYVGDEWVYLEEGGCRMFGLPEPIRVWDWHLDYLPSYRALLDRRERLKLRVIKGAVQGARRAIGNGSGRLSSARHLLTRLVPLLRRQLHVNWAPEQIFGASSLALSGTPDKVFFVASHELPDVTVERMPPDEVADRMIFSLQDERDDFMAYYRKFRFAFPDRPNAFIEGADELQRSLLERALRGKEAYAVHHPYPVAIPQLFEAIRPLL